MGASGDSPEPRSPNPVRTGGRKTAFRFMKPMLSGSAPQSETKRSWSGFRTGRAHADWLLSGVFNCFRHVSGQQQMLP